MGANFLRLPVLICDSDYTRIQSTVEYFQQNGFQPQSAMNGKDAQLMCYNYKFVNVMLDLSVKNHSAFMVLKYIRINQPSCKVVLIYDDQKQLDEWGVTVEELKQFGAFEALPKPVNMEKVKDIFDGKRAFEEWKKKQSSSNPADGDEPVDGTDDEFVPIRFEEFVTGTKTYFDYYVKIEQSKYLKIFKQGDLFDEDRVERYKTDGKLDYLYFKATDRSQYVNFMNKMLESLLRAKNAHVDIKINLTKNVIEKYVDEVFLTGISPDLFEEGQKTCSNVVKLIESSKELSVLMRQFEEIDPAAYSHSFLVTFFATAIVKNLEWGSERIMESVAMGAMLHDIGKIKLPEVLRKKPPLLMTQEELALYHQHPQYGVDYIKSIKFIKGPTKDVILQHHEMCSGEGFPMQLSGIKIFPPAKIVSFANYFADYLMENKLAPMDGLQNILPNRAISQIFDPEVVRAFIKGFINSSKLSVLDSKKKIA
jgi:HD-GYP domain-containing protein (c-di-GMP phosphodiesterase class II)